MRVFFFLGILCASSSIRTLAQDESPTANYIHLISDFFQGRNRVSDDIPLLNGLPRSTSFSCNEIIPGFYADVEYQCQVFHLCTATKEKHTFLCANGTTFNQKVMTCDWWFRSSCEEAPQYFHLNENLYKEETDQNDEAPVTDRQNSGRQLVDPVLSLFISAEPSSRRGKSIATQSFDTGESILSEQYANSPDTSGKFREETHTPINFPPTGRKYFPLRNDQSLPRQNNGYFPPDNEPLPLPDNGYFPPDHKPLPIPDDGYFPPDHKPLPIPDDEYIPPDVEPLPLPDNGYIPPDVKPLPLPENEYLPPDVKPLPLPENEYIPPDDKPLPLPENEYLPPDDKPLPPPDNEYLPPNDKPLPLPENEYLPPDDKPLPVNGYIPPEDESISINSYLTPSNNPPSPPKPEYQLPFSDSSSALVGFSFQVPKEN